jgi:hypothetical protein
VSRKKKKRRPHSGKRRRDNPPRPLPLFPIGTAVRVRRGSTDEDFPDIPLGGWSGTVVEEDWLDGEPLYLVEWDEETLRSVHPIYRFRCERDGLDFESSWLKESELEASTGGPVELEQPTVLVPRPLDDSDPEDRVRMIFGLTSDDPLPAVNPDSLARYHEYLSGQLRFPFAASYSEPTGFLQARLYPVIVLRLWPADQVDEAGLLVEVDYEERTRILPLADIEMAAGEASPLLEDYRYWFEMSEAGIFAPGAPQPQPDALRRSLLSVLGTSMIAGVSTGAVLVGVEGAQTGATIGAWIGGVLGLLVGLVNGWLTARIHRAPIVLLVAAIVGVLVGGTVGALATAIVGVVPGSIVGTLLSRKGGKFVWGLAGACAGALVLALVRGGMEALAGAACGLVLGPLLAALLLLGLVVLMGLATYLRK